MHSLILIVAVCTYKLVPYARNQLNYGMAITILTIVSKISALQGSGEIAGARKVPKDFADNICQECQIRFNSKPFAFAWNFPYMLMQYISMVLPFGT